MVEATRIYDARLAAIEVHSWYLDPLTRNPLAAPDREFRGTVMEVDLPTPPEGGEAVASVSCVSDAWRLSRSLTLKRSDAALQAFVPGDGFRRHNNTRAQTAWGEKLSDGSSGGGGSTTPIDIPRLETGR